MKFTIEAIYTVHLMNNFSDDLMFLPCPHSDLDRKEQLTLTIKQGYEDLKAMGLISQENEPTDECVRYGSYLAEYHQSFEHIRVDLGYFCAAEVDDVGYQSIVIRKVDDNHYVIERLFSLAFLSLLITTHPILKGLEDKQKQYLHSDWELYSYIRLMAYYGDREAIHVTIERDKKVIHDTLYLDMDKGIYEYNLLKEQLRSIAGVDLQHYLIRDLKVKE